MGVISNHEKDDFLDLLREYLQGMSDFVQKLKAGYSEDELEKEKQRINSLRSELEKRNHSQDSTIAS